MYQGKVALRLPLAGRVLVWDGHDYLSHHRRWDYLFARAPRRRAAEPWRETGDHTRCRQRRSAVDRRGVDRRRLLRRTALTASACACASGMLKRAAAPIPSAFPGPPMLPARSSRPKGGEPPSSAPPTAICKLRQSRKATRSRYQNDETQTQLSASHLLHLHLRHLLTRSADRSRRVAQWRRFGARRRFCLHDARKRNHRTPLDPHYRRHYWAPWRSRRMALTSQMTMESPTITRLPATQIVGLHRAGFQRCQAFPRPLSLLIAV